MKTFPMESGLLFGAQEATMFYTPGLLSSENVILRQAQHQLHQIYKRTHKPDRATKRSQLVFQNLC